MSQRNKDDNLEDESYIYENVQGYKGNPSLKQAGEKIRFTKYQLEEISKCIQDPIYFIVKYMRIVNIDEGLVPFNMYDFQKEMIRTFVKNRFVICKIARQSGKSITTIGFLLHRVLFNEYYSIALLANKGQTARDLLGRLQLAYEYLPKWLQQGIVTWNKGSIELANGSKILAAATSSSAVRGGSYSLIFLDEFAHVQNTQAILFFNSVYPTITSGKNSQVIIVSTPLGLNLFYKMWTQAVQKNSQFTPIEVLWNQVPGRDEKFKQETIKNTSLDQWEQEFESLGVETQISINRDEREQNITIGELYETLKRTARKGTKRKVSM